MKEIFFKKAAVISLFSENVFVPRKFFEVVLYNVISKIGCKWLKQGKKITFIFSSELVSYTTRL